MEKIAKTMGMVAEIELYYKSTVRPEDRAVITSSRDAYQILLNSWDERKIELQEQFKIVLMNQSAHCLGILDISTGCINATPVDVRLIFASALKAAAVGMVLAHNHPSGNLKPSREDLQLTDKIQQAGKLLEIQVFDHLIVTPRGYYSFGDEGLL